ncbi:TBC1 domain family member 20 isoform X3 [Myotis daubentonii]|uniref:TBC1 domain family member 20 isoform X3 n=1 Tax=Myotis daubentonii TaxID=98922 RepID=UPI002873E894|nr:TBC1 domain family member 20 isoform X3 [Myotis daubentonii]
MVAEPHPLWGGRRDSAPAHLNGGIGSENWARLRPARSCPATSTDSCHLPGCRAGAQTSAIAALTSVVEKPTTDEQGLPTSAAGCQAVLTAVSSWSMKRGELLTENQLPWQISMPKEQREGLQEELIDIILLVLERNPQLHYYQGYHDIVVTFLLVVGESLATSLVEKVSTHHLRDFMDPTMDNTKHILNYLMPIIDQVNPELHDFMQSAEVGTIFALSWLITWFGHVLSDFRHVVRLYDFFLACHPLMPIYFAAVIVLYREEEVLDCDCDMASVHHLLSQIPQDLPYEMLISRAGDLFVQFPPSRLAWEAAAQQEANKTAASTFKDFELASTQQRPDMVLRQRFRGLRTENRTKDVLTKPRTNRLVKLAVMGLTVALGAAALAVVKSALEWAPKFQLQLFP